MTSSLDEALRTLVRDVVREELRAQASATSRDTQETSQQDAVYISTRQAAKIAGVHPATIRDWMHRGLLQEHHAGRELRVHSGELHALMRGAKKAPSQVIDLDARADEILSRAKRRRGNSR
jgi:excisionase family DNA binding protein